MATKSKGKEAITPEEVYEIVTLDRIRERVHENYLEKYRTRKVDGKWTQVPILTVLSKLVLCRPQ